MPPYRLNLVQNYILRDAPVAPEHLPEPEPVDIEEMARLAASAFPDIPSIASKLRDFGPQVLTMSTSVASAADNFGVDQPTAYRIASFLELAQRLYAPAQGTLPLIRSIEDVYKHCQPLTLQSQEQLHVLLVNNRYQLIHQQLIAIGTRGGMQGVRPADVIQPAVERRVSGFVMVHNHPSGDPTPSTEDLSFTREVQEAADLLKIELLDHVIVAQGGFASALNRD